MQQNCIDAISHLEGLENLDTLNLSGNPITKLEGLDCCPNLKTLICVSARLETLESIEHLAQCTSLQTLDLQNNKLNDPAIIEVIKTMPNLRCLYLKVRHQIASKPTLLCACLPSSLCCCWATHFGTVLPSALPWPTVIIIARTLWPLSIELGSRLAGVRRATRPCRGSRTTASRW